LLSSSRHTAERRSIPESDPLPPPSQALERELALADVMPVLVRMPSARRAQVCVRAHESAHCGDWTPGVLRGVPALARAQKVALDPHTHKKQPPARSERHGTPRVVDTMR
jgi:hypothetical protein